MDNPFELIEAATPGDSVKITFRGPCSEAELEASLIYYREHYPHLNWEVEGGGAEFSVSVSGERDG